MPACVAGAILLRRREPGTGWAGGRRQRPAGGNPFSDPEVMQPPPPGTVMSQRATAFGVGVSLFGQATPSPGLVERSLAHTQFPLGSPLASLTVQTFGPSFRLCAKRSQNHRREYNRLRGPTFSASHVYQCIYCTQSSCNAHIATTCAVAILNITQFLSFFSSFRSSTPHFLPK